VIATLIVLGWNKNYDALSLYSAEIVPSLSSRALLLLPRWRWSSAGLQGLESLAMRFGLQMLLELDGTGQLLATELAIRRLAFHFDRRSVKVGRLVLSKLV
jgi:hypothetical protein